MPNWFFEENCKGIKFQCKLKNLNFWTKLTQNGYFWFKKGKKKNHHRILHIRISFGAKFQLQQTILVFWTKFLQKMYFWMKTEKVNFFIEFWIFKLVLVSNFSLSWQFWFFGPNLLKKGISGWTLKKWTSLLHFAELN